MIDNKNPTQAILKVIRKGCEGKQKREWEAFSRLFLLALEEAYEDGRQAALEFSVEYTQAGYAGQPEKMQ